MDLTEADVRRIADKAAQEVVQRLGVMPQSYRKPETVEQGLQDSMHEETTAAKWYRARAEDATSRGDQETANLYEFVAKEEDRHLEMFAGRREQVIAAGSGSAAIGYHVGDRVEIVSGMQEGHEGTIVLVGGRSISRPGSTMYLVKLDRVANLPEVQRYFNDYEFARIGVAVS